MENYEVIYNYLQTFPKETTVETLIANMDKANDEFIANHNKQLQLLKEEFVGNVYYYEENDDGNVVCKYLTRVKEFSQASFHEFTFLCEIIAITKYEIRYEKEARIDIKALRMAKKVDNEIFDNAKKCVDDLLYLTPEKTETN
jgi:hypothetical protein